MNEEDATKPVTRLELRLQLRAQDWKIAAALLVGQGLARVNVGVPDEANVAAATGVALAFAAKLVAVLR